MKIVFLGTCHGHPEKGRDYTSIALEIGGFVYLFDTGASVANKMLEYGLEIPRLKSVFITHMHGDHVNGILRLVDILSWANRLYNYVTVDYYFPETRGVNEIKELCTVIKAPFDEEKNIFHIYPSDFVYDDGLIKVTAIPTRHLSDKGFPSYGFMIEAEGKRIVITGDMSDKLKYNDFPEVAKTLKTDLLISEMAHFDFEVLRPHLKLAKTRMLYLTHIKFPNERIPLLERENASGEFSFPIVAANDGDVIEL